MKHYVCVDIGGTSIKYGLLNEQAEFLEKSSVETEAWLGGKNILEKVKRIIQEFRTAFPEKEIAGVGISTAGMIDCEEGKVFYSGALIPDYIGTEFKKTIEEVFQIPCEVENDVNCAGLAEATSGAAKGSRIAVCLTVGTGIGGCILIDGQVFHGFSNSACEIGYLHMKDSDYQTLGATSILCKRVAAEKGGTPAEWNGERIMKEWKAGDEVCIRAVEEMCDVLGEGIANICYVLNPEVIVLGGGIMAEKEILRPRLEAAAAKYLKPIIWEHTRLEFAFHKNDAGMLGAFYHFQSMRKKRVDNPIPIC